MAGFNYQDLRAVLIYSLMQLPGILFLVTILLWAWDREWISGRAVWGVMGAWIIKDALFFRFYRKALTQSPQNVIARLHGSMAVVRTTLDPAGQVRLRGEIWRAVSIDGKIHEPGTQVRVEGNTGLTLEVRRPDHGSKCKES